MALSRFAGLYNAAEFAYGVNKTTPALQVINGPNTTGSGTLTLVYGSLALADGTVISPLNTNAPITVGGDSNIETVTPSAVSASTPLIYSSTTVTATFTYLHGNGDSIRSGTVGLQEALNYAATRGGGEVIIDAGWVALGGTQAMVEAATIPAGVDIWDNRGASGISDGLQTANVTLTNAQVLGMYATPVEIMPAPSTNSYYQVLGVDLVNLNTGVAYASGGVIQLQYANTAHGAGTDASSGTVAATFLTTPTATEVIHVGAGNTSATAGTSVLNTGLYLSNQTGAFTTGTGTLQVVVTYLEILT